jgi:hypothetical protein
MDVLGTWEAVTATGGERRSAETESRNQSTRRCTDDAAAGDAGSEVFGELIEALTVHRVPLYTAAAIVDAPRKACTPKRLRTPVIGGSLFTSLVTGIGRIPHFLNR